jgi:hypothetical protein
MEIHASLPFSINSQPEYANIEFRDLTTLATVGIGGFGRVVLVKYVKDNALKLFALKQMKKVHILDTKQEEHVFNERRIMLSCELSFCCESSCEMRAKSFHCEREPKRQRHERKLFRLCFRLLRKAANKSFS